MDLKKFYSKKKNPMTGSIDLPQPVLEQKVISLSFVANAATMLDSNSILIIKNNLNIIYGYQIDPFVELFRIFTRSHDMRGIWYIKTHDVILLMDYNDAINEIQIRLLFNWRPIEQQGNIGYILIPEENVTPKNWRFPSPTHNKFESFLLASFKQTENPTCEVFDNSILIISGSTIIIWDLHDRPVLRSIIFLPLQIQTQRPLFSFKGNRLALITKGVLFIIKILENAPQTNEVPFTTGTNCLKLEENNLYIDFGLSQEYRNMLFIERHLPDRDISIQIVFQLTLPGTPQGIKFLSENLLILITTEVVLGCTRKLTKSGREYFDPARLRDSHGDKFIQYNQNFVFLYNSEHLDIIPNPEKSSIDFSNSTIQELMCIKFQNLLFMCVDEKRCLFAMSPEIDLQKNRLKRESSKDMAPSLGSTLYRIDFRDVNDIANEAIKMPSVEAKMIGIRLLDPRSPYFADTAYEIGFQLLKASRKPESVPFLIKAFNYGSKEKRKAILQEISNFDRRLTKQRMLFVEGAEFQKDEITEMFLDDIMKLDDRLSAIKLIQAQKFESTIKVSDNTEGLLFQAIIASLNTDHNKAKELFLKVDDSLIATLDDSTLSKVSKDIKPAVLVRLGKPSFENDIWSLYERLAAFKFMNKMAGEAIEYCAKDSEEQWHFTDWPVVPKLCKWIKGNEKLQFVACCVCEFNISNRSNESFTKLIEGINLAKSGEYKRAVDVFGPEIYRINFLKYFAKSTADWIKIMQQFENDDEIHQVSTHFLIENSPQDEYYTSTAPIKDEPEFDSIFEELKEDDIALIKLLSVDQ